jgi:hypothetical protein
MVSKVSAIQLHEELHSQAIVLVPGLLCPSHYSRDLQEHTRRIDCRRLDDVRGAEVRADAHRP